ncbi:T6SS phospholipase effector Tle1-like catalytic domain-containing protein, partial [Xanthovirga aplysinae]|uniref:phospholipase effector Tle1 domain-containing protein n=1 Tax=Xanthovirga aplysinae TaxID=2529853 RepID=UPI001656CA23
PHFIGVWDTVASLGYFNGKRFFDEALNPEIKLAYHALSIDEHREKFLPSLWNENKKGQKQVIEQVWFSGVHCDVGGWYDERG